MFSPAFSVFSGTAEHPCLSGDFVRFGCDNKPTKLKPLPSVEETVNSGSLVSLDKRQFHSLVLIQVLDQLSSFADVSFLQDACSYRIPDPPRSIPMDAVR